VGARDSGHPAVAARRRRLQRRSRNLCEWTRDPARTRSAARGRGARGPPPRARDAGRGRRSSRRQPPRLACDDAPPEPQRRRRLGRLDGRQLHPDAPAQERRPRLMLRGAPTTRARRRAPGPAEPAAGEPGAGCAFGPAAVPSAGPSPAEGHRERRGAAAPTSSPPSRAHPRASPRCRRPRPKPGRCRRAPRSGRPPTHRRAGRGRLRDHRRAAAHVVEADRLLVRAAQRHELVAGLRELRIGKILRVVLARGLGVAVLENWRGVVLVRARRRSAPRNGSWAG
jgi:hypothetical protein